MLAGPARRRATHVLFFSLAGALVISRRPDAVFHAQFYAEDGAVWFHDAHESGARALLFSRGGYLNSVSRLVALVAQWLPLANVPLFMNVCAIALQVLPVVFFLSSRFSSLSLRMRLIAAFVYLAI